MTAPAPDAVLGHGYLGERLARSLAAGGGTVIATRRRPGFPTGSGVIPRVWDADRSSLPELESILAGSRDVYVTVAPGRGGDPGLYPATAELLVRADPPGLRSLVFVSSTSVYGVSGGEEVDEKTPADGGGSPAGGRLVEAERILLDSDLPVRIVRSAGIYGPDRLLLGSREPGAILRGRGDAWLNLIHVDDLVRVLRAAAETGEDGSITLASGVPVTRRAFYDAVAHALGRPPVRFAGDAGGHTMPLGKRIRAERGLRALGMVLAHPDIESGIAASLPPGIAPE